MLKKNSIIFISTFLIIVSIACTEKKEEKKKTISSVTKRDSIDRKWWKEAIVYQIYPRSFKDNNGNGVGDLSGITSKLDYVKSLGVDVIWLNPIFASPNDDNGYDISDYKAIMKEFGTIADFDTMLKEMHERKLKLVLDLVANHSSDENEWFKQARSSRNNPYRNYYHWWNAEKGAPPKRFSFFDVKSDAWEYVKHTNSYYLHTFSDKQPDLNWENPQVREEIFKMMRFWFDKGVDGFRMDVIPFISKDTTFPALPEKYKGDFVSYYANGPHLHEYLQEMHKKALSPYDVMTVAEGIGVTTSTALDFVDPQRNELNMLYHFEGMGLGYLPNEFKAPDPKGYSLLEFKKIYSKWDSTFAERGWGTIYLGNHDQPRMVTRWGNDSPEFREYSSKMLTTFLMTMRATPYYYFGDELGMNNIKFNTIHDYQDIESKNMYLKVKNERGDLRKFIENQKISARDNGRTPFQWKDTLNAGFTTGKPWLKVNPNYKTVNVEAEEKDSASVLNYFKKIVRLRKNNPVLVYGKYTLIDKENANVYAYTRELDGKKWLVLLNFKPQKSTVNLKGIDLGNASMILSNYIQSTKGGIELRPYEAVIYEVK
jgi:oligo-1,6-glucosidase